MPMTSSITSFMTSRSRLVCACGAALVLAMVAAIAPATAQFPAAPDDAEGTMLALCGLVYRTVKYQRRSDKGVQNPARTLELGTGSCRDMATLMMEAARLLGVAARFASGYLHCTASMAGHASTHAWGSTVSSPSSTASTAARSAPSAH